jgi:catechol-2,3-dioxygenase
MTELAPAAGRDTAAIGTLTTTIIECADLTRTLPFYTEQLGLEVLSQGESFSVLATGSASIVLWQGAKTDVVIAFTGADLDQARSLLESRGAEVGPNGTHPTGEHFYVTDPEGNDIMIST